MNALRLPLPNRNDRLFFGGMGLAMILTVFVGFAPTFYLLPGDARPLTPLLHVHGLIASAWMLLFIVQTGLIAAHRADIHRRLGPVGAAIALALVVVTMMASIANRGVTERLVFPAGAVLMFISYVTAGFMQRRHPDAHKRLMLLATITLLPPALARMHLPLLPRGTFTPNFVGLLFLLPAFAHDLATRAKIHPALLWGGLFMMLMLPLRFFIRDYVL